MNDNQQRFIYIETEFMLMYDQQFIWNVHIQSMYICDV